MLIVRTYTNKRNIKDVSWHSVEVIHNNKLLAFYPKLCNTGLKEILKQYDHSLLRHVNVISSRELNIIDAVVL